MITDLHPGSRNGSSLLRILFNRPTYFIECGFGVLRLKDAEHLVNLTRWSIVKSQCNNNFLSVNPVRQATKELKSSGLGFLPEAAAHRHEQKGENGHRQERFESSPTPSAVYLRWESRWRVSFYDRVSLKRPHAFNSSFGGASLPHLRLGCHPKRPPNSARNSAYLNGARTASITGTPNSRCIVS